MHEIYGSSTENQHVLGRQMLRLIKCSLCGVSILKKKRYGTNMFFTMPPHLKNLENRYSDCYYYKQMEKFLVLVLQ